MQSAHEELAKFLAGAGPDGVDLARALHLSRNPVLEQPADIVWAYGVLGFWYAESKAVKRDASAGDEKKRLQRIEDILEAAVKTVHAGLIARQHVNNMTERFNS